MRRAAKTIERKLFHHGFVHEESKSNKKNIRIRFSVVGIAATAFYSMCMYQPASPGKKTFLNVPRVPPRHQSFV